MGPETGAAEVALLLLTTVVERLWFDWVTSAAKALAEPMMSHAPTLRPAASRWRRPITRLTAAALSRQAAIRYFTMSPKISFVDQIWTVDRSIADLSPHSAMS